MFLALIMMVASAEAPPRFDSAYTSLDLDRCPRTDSGLEPQSAAWRCPGYGGISLLVENGDDRFDLDAGLADNDEFWGATFDYPAGTVEWRLLDGKPIAIIYRLVAATKKARRTSRLIVETIGGVAPGCRIASIDGEAENANELARAVADRVAAGDTRCLGSDRTGRPGTSRN